MCPRAFAILILIQANFAIGYNVLGLFPHPGKSHYDVFKPLLIELANRGHNVTTMSFFPLDNPPENYTDVSLVGLSEIHVERIEMSDFENSHYGLYRYIRAYMTMRPLDQFAVNICKTIYNWPTVKKLITDDVKYDIVLVEGFNSECMLPYAHQHGVPVITMSSCAMIHWTADHFGVPEYPSFVPTSGVTVAGELSLWERFTNAAFLYYYKIWYRYAIRTKEEEIVKKTFGRDIDLEVLSKSSSLLFMNTHHSFNGARPTPPGVVEVGGMHLNKTRINLPADMAKFIENSSKDIVVFSLGSMMKSSSMSKRIQEIFIRVFSKFPIRVIWKWDTGEIDGAGENILVSKWIPQYELLRNPKVVAFIGHGGLLGTTEAIDAGKPMMLIPFFGDQPTNAAKSIHAGLGVLMEYCEITEERLTESMDKLLSQKLRKSAQRLSRVWHDRYMEPLDEAVFWTERTARLGHDAQMIPILRQEPFYKTAMLDVVALGISIIMLMLVLFALTVKLILKCVKGRSRNKEKLG